MDDLDALLAARAGASPAAVPVPTPAAAPASDPLDALLQARAQGASLPASQAPKTGGTGNALLDAQNAVGTGGLRGFVNLAGLPVDTVANVLDLGKAALGSGYQALTGKPAPDALQVGDRSDVVGSGAWLQKHLSATAPGDLLLNPVNPSYEGGYLQNAGAALTGVVSPNSKAELVKQLLLSEAGATAAKAVKDSGGSDAAAIAASLMPQGIAHYGSAGVKTLVRGGEAGRQQMQARIQALQDAGVSNPTLGLASGNATVGGVENILQNTPGAVGIMSRARNDAVAGLQQTVADSAQAASPNRGALESGMAIQKGINDFKDQFKANQGTLYGNLDQYIPGQTPVDVGNTKQTLAGLNADIPGAPALSKFFKNEKIQALQSAINSDTSGAPASVQVYAQPPVAGGGIMNTPIPRPPIQVAIPESPPTNTLPFEAVKKTRTLVGNEIADNSLMSTVPQSKWRALYGGLSEDMGQAATQAGPQAEQAFNRATDYTRAGSQRLERVAPFAQTTAPEQAYTALVNATKENVSTLQAVKKTLPPDARGTIAGTVIERLGKANNGVQNESGTAWSPETFLTNWNKMTPAARDQLFSGFPNSADVKANVDAVAKATSMMRDNSKMWANPSGTGANWAARASLGAVGIGGTAALNGLVNPWIPAGVAAGMGGANLLARMLTNKNIVNNVASPSRLTQNDVSSLVRMLQATGQTP